MKTEKKKKKKEQSAVCHPLTRANCSRGTTLNRGLAGLKLTHHHHHPTFFILYITCSVLCICYEVTTAEK